MITLEIVFNKVQMKNKFKYFFFLLFFALTSCSFDKKSGLWDGYEEELERVTELERQSKIISSKIFSSEDTFAQIIPIKNNIVLEKPQKNNDWLMPGSNLQNLTGNLYLRSINNIFLKKKVGKDKFDLYQKMQAPLFFKNNIVASDDRGSIKKVNKDGDAYWSINIYKKIYKKLYKNLTFALYEDKVFVADNIGFIYVINYENGELIWKKNFGIPFKSNIRIYKNKIFVIDQDNRILCLDSTNGDLIWDIRTIETFIKSQNLLGLAISKDGILIALNSAGDLFKIDTNTGRIFWTINTLYSLSKYESDFFKSSDIVIDGVDIIFSSASSTFSINIENGYTNWIVKPRSSNRPIVVKKAIFLVTDNGYLVSLDRKSGKILFSSDILKVLKKKAKAKAKISGYIMGSNKIYITTSNGYLIVCSYRGELEGYERIAKSINTSPVITDGELYVLSSNSKIIGFR